MFPTPANEWGPLLVLLRSVLTKIRPTVFTITKLHKYPLLFYICSVLLFFELISNYYNCLCGHILISPKKKKKSIILFDETSFLWNSLFFFYQSCSCRLLSNSRFSTHIIQQPPFAPSHIYLTIHHIQTSVFPRRKLILAPDTEVAERDHSPRCV